MKKPGKGKGPKESLRIQAEGRDRAVDVREAAIDKREITASERELTATDRETTAGEREVAVGEREEVALLRERALHTESQIRRIAEAQAHLLGQMRVANEKLVLATLRADEMAIEAFVAQRTIAESEERFRTLVVTSSSVIWHANAAGRIRVDQESWSLFTGGRPDEREDPDGWAWLDAVHPEDRTALRDAWEKAITARGAFSFQHRLQRRDRTWAWVMSRAVPIQREGAIREWQGMMVDITDRIRVEEARERFIGILGHDLRSPLAAILTGAEYLDKAGLPERSAAMARQIASSAWRIDGIVRDMLDFARGRLAGGIPIKRVSCDLGAIAVNSVEEMKLAHPGRTIRFEGAGELEGEWDADRLPQVLSNLIGNAIRHGADPIRVEVTAEGDAVVLAVHNRGTPIPPEQIDRLFEPFQRGEDGSESEGLGLGLYIVSEIVRSHGASIEVRSTKEDGTAFISTWPRFPPGSTRRG